MAIDAEQLADIRKNIADGNAPGKEFLVGTSGDLEALKGALTKVFYMHGGQIVHEFKTIRTVSVKGLSDTGLEAVAALPETDSIDPDYRLKPC